MRMAQIAPLFESVPPRLYGGTERVVSYLTEELVRQGHQVTLFASGDSITSAELVPCIPCALRLDPNVRDPLPHHMVMLDKVAERAGEFDVLHFHIDYLHFPHFRSERGRTLTTLHGRQDLADHMPFYSRFADMPLVSISNAQRAPLPGANFVATVHHGLPVDLLTRTSPREAATLPSSAAFRQRNGPTARLQLRGKPVFPSRSRQRSTRRTTSTSATSLRQC
jgi:glycosyltransferase involved in cell wall biosynthesis